MAYESVFIKGSAQVVEPPQVVYKGTKFKYSVKGDIIRAIIVRTVKPSLNKTGTSVFVDSNSLLTIKKRQTPKSRYVKGIVIKNAVKRKKFITLFKKAY